MKTQTKLQIMISLGALLTATQSFAAMSCSLVLQVQTREVRRLVQEDAFTQWMRWEQTSNFAPFVKSTSSVKLPYTVLPTSDVDVQVDETLPSSIASLLTGSENALWVKHPYNTAIDTPHLKDPTQGSLTAYFSASRSMILTGDLRGFTIKVPTDHPHGPKGEYQPSKAQTADDVVSALLHSKHIKDRDAALGADPVLMILPEVMTVSDKRTQTGYVLRDIRQTDDGHYYLPALSIPYAGREIAAANGVPLEEFWQEHYARVLGEAKARLLLRYGLQMETPNAQNMLIQLDRNLKPTGKIVFRDVSDAFFVDKIAQPLGFEKDVENDIKVSYTPSNILRPYISNSLWRMNEAGNKSVSYGALKHWTITHNKAYVQYVLNELGVTDQPRLLVAEMNLDELNGLYKFLKSPEGQSALLLYRQKQDSQQRVADAG